MKLVKVIAFLSLTVVDFAYGAPDTLPVQKVEQKLLTLSGFSSGGSMAQQFLVAYSSKYLGVASFSDSFYRCGSGNGNAEDWLKVCSIRNGANGSYDTQLVHQDIKDYVSNGYIDDTKNLRNRRLYLYTGLRSSAFSPLQGLSALKVFERYVRNAKRFYTRVQDSEYLFPTENKEGSRCTQPADEYDFIGNCGFSGVYESMNFLLGSDAYIKEPKWFERSEWEEMKLRLREFDQTEFTKGLKNTFLDKVGYYYMPTNCKKGWTCMLHVYFHGCKSGREFLGTNQIIKSGFLEMAETNDIIILFPQVLSSGKNKIGCWDNIGLSGPLFATQKGPQMMAVTKMIDKIAGFTKIRK